MQLLSSMRDLDASIAEKSGADSKALEEVEAAQEVSSIAAKQLSDIEIEFQVLSLSCQPLSHLQAQRPQFVCPLLPKE